MTGITGYKCDQCGQEEHSVQKAPIHYTLVLPEDIPLEVVLASPYHRKRWDFCCLECLAEWAMEETS